MGGRPIRVIAYSSSGDVLGTFTPRKFDWVGTICTTRRFIRWRSILSIRTFCFRNLRASRVVLEYQSEI